MLSIVVVLAQLLAAPSDSQKCDHSNDCKAARNTTSDRHSIALTASASRFFSVAGDIREFSRSCRIVPVAPHILCGPLSGGKVIDEWRCRYPNNNVRNVSLIPYIV